MKLCINCKHFVSKSTRGGNGGTPQACVAFAGKIDPVDGAVLSDMSVYFMRAVCGWEEPKYFVEKERGDAVGDQKQ